MNKQYGKLFEEINHRDFIVVKGARVNNLKNIDVAFPRNKMIVVTGVSGSGKSSLAFDTLFAEGQRMYIESLSSYARQFLGKLEKPDVDYIAGLSPAIAIEQKVNTRNTRSTVGTTTEIFDYVKLLFARIGRTFSPISGREVTADSVSDIADKLQNLPNGTKIMILAPIILHHGRTAKQELDVLTSKGFTRIYSNEQVINIEDLTDIDHLDNHYILVDRLTINSEEDDQRFRITDSLQSAYFEGGDNCVVQILGGATMFFSERFEADGIEFEVPSVNLFSFNNPYGACKRCEGYGTILGIDPNLVFPNPDMSVFEGAIAPWRGEAMKARWLEPLLKSAYKFDFPVHRAFSDLEPEEIDLLWKGNEHFEGLDAFFEFVNSELHKIQYRVMLSRFRGRTQCPDCRGTRIRKDAHYVKINDKSVQDVVLMPIADLVPFFANLQLTDNEREVSRRILLEINSRLGFMLEVGLGYLTLNRITATLSGGEFQRIKLATSLGSALVGSMYILDEPSIGLHPRDTSRLIGVLHRLRDLGNTVVVVEHEEDIMRAADALIDIGPDAGENGGKLIFADYLKNIDKIQIPEGTKSHTLDFLNHQIAIDPPDTLRIPKHWITLTGARENNLKNISVKFPLEVMFCVTGVSGSGKSTLISRVLYPAMLRAMGGSPEEYGRFDRLDGAISKVTQIEFVDQNPIGRSTRSNPVTYLKAYDAIRDLFAKQPEAVRQTFTPKHFSFNVEGGRCETCAGEGTITVEMQFMADVVLTCESCQGKRFKPEVLEVTYNGLSINDVLNLTIDQALEFFAKEKTIAERIEPLQRVGLGYLRLGQSSATLSGGEAQRVKLAYFLSKANPIKKGMFFIFDEPTTGLHFADIQKLLISMQSLVDNGNTVAIIEHNPEVIKCADWVIDLGPDGGNNGGNLVFEGTPADLAKQANSFTGKYLSQKIK